MTLDALGPQSRVTRYLSLSLVLSFYFLLQQMSMDSANLAVCQWNLRGSASQFSLIQRDIERRSLDVDVFLFKILLY